MSRKNTNAYGMKQGVESIHNHTRIHNNINSLTMYVL